MSCFYYSIMSKWDDHRTTQIEVERDIQALSRITLIKGLPRPIIDQLEIRAIVGHAQSGHRGFRNNRKINANLKDIISQVVNGGLVSFKTTYDFDNHSYNLFYGISQNVEKALISLKNNCSEKSVTLTKSFNPLWNNAKVLPLSFLQGFYFGGNFDNFDLRKIAEIRYGINIGGGESHLIDFDKLRHQNINLTDLTKKKYGGELSFLNDLENGEVIKTLTSKGIILPQREIDISNIYSLKELEEQLKPRLKNSNFQEYIRKKKGVGVSDDIACSTVVNFIDFSNKNKDVRHYFSLSIGAYMADFIDSISKTPYLYAPSGLDTLLAEYANQRTINILRQKSQDSMSKLEKKIIKDGNLIDKNQLVDLIALSKNPDRNGIGIVHSSGRYFLEKQQFEKDDVSSFTMEQQIIMAQRILKRVLSIKNRDFKYLTKGNRIVPNASYGFHRTNSNSLNRYLVSKTFLDSLRSTDESRRQEKIHEFYSSSN